MKPTLTLISHALCPYVQRVAIVLAEKGLPFERRAIDLSGKPDWFLAVSPLGKTPVLLVDGQPLFESAAICDYLDDEYEPKMHPRNALIRARHRAWIEFASATLASVAGLYGCAADDALAVRSEDLKAKFGTLELALAGSERAGPFFSGPDFALVDAAFAPVFRYADLFGHLRGLNFLEAMPEVSRWRQALQARLSVRNAVADDYPQRLHGFVLGKHGALARALLLAPPPASGRGA
ncbi:glutathione S-transferase family protein [Massilia pseudoviolaceinigra]|uniref:glutathione S-transferase family protein n=1 Tax=Massilia pseudoviolaceinigra TaxID=3057165 RepID=UPI0027965679|nr:glutathione S-transferase family protein [Massilia sp. CCM 9206]MDQ1919374.1 glutathione S-transferase family protein [Massilia sp. CCM 9206]